jgi:hypothetical protein
MNRDQWLAFLRSEDEEAKELLQRHPGLEPPENDSDLKARWKDPGFRARNAAAVRENWKDPGFRARNAAAVSTAQRRRWRAYRRKPSP